LREQKKRFQPRNAAKKEFFSYHLSIMSPYSKPRSGAYAAFRG
jgi:hypothetical protein